MATTKEARRRRPRRRKARESATTVAESRRRKKRRSSKRRAREVVQAKAPRRRKRRSRSYMMAPKRRRKRRATREAWYGQPIRHRKAAKKGLRRKAIRRSRRRSRAREVVAEVTTVASPRRRRRRSHKRHSYARTTGMTRYRARSAPRRAGLFEARGGTGYVAELAASVVAGGVGFILADALDRFLATYDPSKPERPKDKFTSDGAGTLANTLNIAQSPDIMRIAAGVGVTALPALASVYTKNRLLKSSLQGAAIGAGVKLFATFWNNVVMGSWLGPKKDASTQDLQKSYIARLYPAEVAAGINVANGQTQAPPTAGFGMLSGQADVGPFALSAYQQPQAGVGATFTPAPGPQMTPANAGPPVMPSSKEECGSCVGEPPFLGSLGDESKESLSSVLL